MDPYAPQRRSPRGRLALALVFLTIFGFSSSLLIKQQLFARNPEPCPAGSNRSGEACVLWTPTPVSNESASTTDDIASNRQSTASDDNDNDRDGIPNDQDNCPDQPNADQEDRDGDGFRSACDENDGPDAQVIANQDSPESSTTTRFLANPSSAESDVPSSTAPEVAPGAWEEFATNISGGQQIIMPTDPVGPSELYLAHGDIYGTGGCTYLIFDSGEIIGGLSSATWRLEQLAGGTHEQRIAEATARGKQECGQ